MPGSIDCIHDELTTHVAERDRAIEAAPHPVAAGGAEYAAAVAVFPSEAASHLQPSPVRSLSLPLAKLSGQ
jgi:hypothetical protein